MAAKYDGILDRTLVASLWSKIKLKITGEASKIWNGYTTESNIMVGYRRQFVNPGTPESKSGCYCSKEMIEIPEEASSITWNPNTDVSSYSNDIVLYTSEGSFVKGIYGGTSQTVSLSQYSTAKYVGFSAYDSTVFAGVATYDTASQTGIRLWAADTGSYKTGVNGKQDTLTAGDNITIADNTISADKGSVVTMADNSTAGVDITVDGTSKTLAKETDLSKYLPLTGGVLTGILYVKDSTIRIKNSSFTKGTAPSSTAYVGLTAIDNNTSNNGRLWNLEASYNTSNQNVVNLRQYTSTSTNTVGSVITLTDDKITLKADSDSCSFSEGAFGIGNTSLYDGCLEYNSSSRLCLAGKAIDVNNAGRTAYAAIYASAFTVSSSEKVKTNIQDLTEEEAKKILNIRPVSFDYKDFYGGSKGKRGVIAEEVLPIIPSVVTVPDDYNENDFDETKGIQQLVPGVDYASFAPYLIKMVQIQQKQIDELTERINELEKSKE